MVAGREVGRQQLHSREVHGAVREQVEDQRKPASGARDLDPGVGLPLGEAERIAAVDVERPVALAYVHLARIELRDVSHDLGGHVALLADERLETGDEVVVGEATKSSEHFVLHDFL